MIHYQSEVHRLAGLRAAPGALPHLGGRGLAWGAKRLSELHKEGHMTTGHRLFGKDLLRFNATPCHHMPLLVHL